MKKEFDNSATLRRKFKITMFATPIFFTVAAFVIVLFEDATKLSQIVKILPLLFLVVLVISTIAAFVKSRSYEKLKVVVEGEEVTFSFDDVIKTYRIVDFVERVNNNSESEEEFLSPSADVIFVGEDGEEENVECSELGYSRIELIDEIVIRKHELLGLDNSEEKVFLENGVYERILPEETGEEQVNEEAGLPIEKMVVPMGVLVAGVATVLSFSVEKNSAKIIFAIIAVASLVMMVMYKLLVKRIDGHSNDTNVKKFEIGQFGFMKDGKEIKYADIEAIDMTRPYLKRILDSKREMRIKLKNDADIKAYCFGDRPYEEDDTDDYERLYNSVMRVCEQQEIKIGIVTDVNKSNA